MGNSKYSLGMLLRLITLVSAITTLSCAAFSTRLYAHAISPTIGLPDIGWDSAPPGAVGGITTFAPGTGLLSITGSVVSFIPNTVPGPLMVGGTVSIYASLVGTTAGVGSIHADFGTTGGANPNFTGLDVEVRDSVGVLALAGNFGGLTIDGFYGSNIGFGGAIFTPTLGYLLPDFPVPAGIVHLEYNLAPTWSATSYTALGGWTSESKGDIGPVPEPATIALLGAGLLGLLGYSRRRFWKRG